MRIPAEQFLTFRAYGAPPIVIALAAQGAFRGLMDTKTPLYAVGKLIETLLAAEMNKLVMDKSHVWLVFVGLCFVGLCCSHGPCGCFSVFRTAS
jgi:hypothetical protein